MKISVNLVFIAAAIVSILINSTITICAPVVAKDVSDEQLLHPVFHSRQNFCKSRLTRDAYRKMINLPVRTSQRNTWASVFGRLEARTSSDLCDLLSGLTKKEVTDWLGEPAFKMGSDLCFQKTQPESRGIALLHRDIKAPFDDIDDNWLYFYGGRPSVTRLYFKGDKCIGALPDSHENDALYNMWRFEDLSRNAVGLSLKELIEQEGPSNTETDKSFERTLLEKDAPTAAILKSADDVLYYQFGEVIGAVLAIKITTVSLSVRLIQSPVPSGKRITSTNPGKLDLDPQCSFWQSLVALLTSSTCQSFQAQ